MNILAFDQATSVGWCHLDGGQLIDYGVQSFKYYTKESEKRELKEIYCYDESVDLYLWAEKTKKIKEFVFSKYDEIKPDIIVFETVQDNNNHDIHTKLAGLLNVLTAECCSRGILFLVIPISSWKSNSGVKLKKLNLNGKYIATTRDEQKESAIDLVNKKFKINVKTDVADAICIALATERIKGKNK